MFPAFNFKFKIIAVPKQSSVSKAVIPVAGLGTRLLPASLVTPKELWSLLGVPVLQVIVEEILAAKITEVIFVVSPQKAMVREYFSRRGNHRLKKLCEQTGQLALWQRHARLFAKAKFKFCEQVKPRGDGQAILQARKLVGNNPFLVVFGDEISLKENSSRKLINLFQRRPGAAVALARVPSAEVSKYGIVQPGQQSSSLVEVRSLIEKPSIKKAPSDLALTGKYVLPPEIFGLLQKLAPAKKELRLIDALAELRQVSPIWGQIIPGLRLDTGNHFGFLQAQIELAYREPKLKTALQQYLRKLLG